MALALTGPLYIAAPRAGTPIVLRPPPAIPRLPGQPIVANNYTTKMPATLHACSSRMRHTAQHRPGTMLSHILRTTSSARKFIVSHPDLLYALLLRRRECND